MSLNIDIRKMSRESRDQIEAMSPEAQRYWWDTMMTVFLVVRLHELNNETLDDFAHRIAMSDGVAGGATVGRRGVDEIRRWLTPYLGVRANVASMSWGRWAWAQAHGRAVTRAALADEVTDIAQHLDALFQDHDDLQDVPMRMRFGSVPVTDAHHGLGTVMRLTQTVAKALRASVDENAD